ncbi:MAG: hypothetical protein J7623_11240 [Chitinophaga sp.]|uniref:hypothetical protein n=1 Tax=Chitinophaga sp. TaxID=1869181 RepID=UPI001B1B4809|nr:hypothetical protein [Chitinophaga sp.]MBO9729200.1 hypothetical protein [Chitinophaga sp.]
MSHTQSIYQIRADSVRIYSTRDIKLLRTGIAGSITIKSAIEGQKLDRNTSIGATVVYLGVTVQAVAGNWYIIAKHQP